MSFIDKLYTLFLYPNYFIGKNISQPNNEINQNTLKGSSVDIWNKYTYQSNLLHSNSISAKSQVAIGPVSSSLDGDLGKTSNSLKETEKPDSGYFRLSDEGEDVT